MIDIMMALFDNETLMKNHDAAVDRKGQKKGQEKTAKAMAFLVENNRLGDVVKASTDESFLSQVIKEFNEYIAGKPTPVK